MKSIFSKYSAIIMSVMFFSLLTSTGIFAVSSATKNTNNNEKQAIKEVSAVSVILKDHAHIKSLFLKLNKSLNSNVEESRNMFKEISEFLKKHETMEQTVWYPELEKHQELKSIIAELKKEEQDAAKALSDIASTKDNAEWVNKVKKLQTDVKHHAKQEETKLFPKVKKVLDKASLNSLGAKLVEYHNNNNMKY